jgi:hypothetical protein
LHVKDKKILHNLGGIFVASCLTIHLAQYHLLHELIAFQYVYDHYNIGEPTKLPQIESARVPPVEWDTDFDQTPLLESGQAERIPDLSMIKPSIGDTRTQQ